MVSIIFAVRHEMGIPGFVGDPSSSKFLNENGLTESRLPASESAIREFPICARRALLDKKSQNKGLPSFSHKWERAKVKPEARPQIEARKRIFGVIKGDV
jgi:hypothetical protein